VDHPIAGETALRSRPVILVVLAIAALILSYCINAMDRTLFPLLLTDVRAEYGLGLPEAGLLSTIFTLGMGLAGLPTGYLMSRHSRKTVIQIGIFIYSAATIITILAYGFADMLFYRAVTGIGEAMQLTALLAVFSSYFPRHGAMAVGGFNYAYASGVIIAPMLGTGLLLSYGTWRAPMIIFGALGFAIMALVALAVRPWFSEVKAGKQQTLIAGGAARLNNRNTLVLTALSVILGLGLYGYFGMYPTFLREELHFAPNDIGQAMSSYGLGALVSAGTGWLGDRFSPRAILALGFLFASLVAVAIFNGPTGAGAQAICSFALGAAFSGTLFVALAAYQVKSVTGELSGRASGLFVTSLFGSGTVAGYSIGWLVRLYGWTIAGNVQLALLCLIGATLALIVRPDLMANRSKSATSNV
jgi:MFS transporter, DHA1 family, inner membrane transport protein